jgi:hypothetical protein
LLLKNAKNANCQVTCKTQIILIRLFYNYFLMENPVRNLEVELSKDEHVWQEISGCAGKHNNYGIG